LWFSGKRLEMRAVEFLRRALFSLVEVHDGLGDIAHEIAAVALVSWCGQIVPRNCAHGISALEHPQGSVKRTARTNPMSPVVTNARPIACRR